MNRALETRGHTLLELAISMALGLLVIVAVLSLYRGQRNAHDRAADNARIHDAAGTALDLIGQQVQMAGSDLPDTSTGLFGCSQARPTGSDANPVCETLASRSDGIVVRYAADTVSTWPSASGLPTDCLGQAVGVQVTNRYYAKASSSTGEPELYCEGSGKANSGQPLVEGIERLKIGYWLKGGLLAIAASALTREQWALVVAVDVCVLARGEANGAAARTRYPDCDGAWVISADTRARQAFWRRIAVRNGVTEGLKSAPAGGAP
jgi:type IV pilus assembly protein PilW